MSSMRQVDAPRRKVSPGRLSYTISSSSSPTRVPSGSVTVNKPAVGDGARVGDGEALRAGAAAHHALHAVPHDAWPQLGELLRRVPAREEVEHRRQHLVGELGEGRRAPDHVREVVEPPLVERAHRDDLLAEHVEGVARVVRLLDLPGLHPLDDDGGLEQVGPVLREQLPAAGRAHLVAGPTDALQARWRRRRATPPARRGRPRPCRCPARGWTWRRGPSAGRTSARPRSGGGARGTASRGGPSPAPRAPAGCPRPPRRGSRPSQCSSLRRVASRSASRRAFTKISVERCSRTSSSSRGCMAGQIEWRAGPAPAGPTWTDSPAPR